MTRLILPDESFLEDRIAVSGDELHYLARVRRHKPGDRVEVRGAEGQRFLCAIARIDSKEAILIPEQKLGKAPTSWPVTLIAAVPKSTLFDDVVRKVSEIGVARLIPVRTERSVANPGPARVDRWRKIARESLRQCGRETPLRVDDVTPLSQALAKFCDRGNRFILHPQGTLQSLSTELKECDPRAPMTAVIGPEGGFTRTEVDLASKLGYKPVSLGSSIMRIETATIAAAVLCTAHLGGLEPA